MEENRFTNAQRVALAAAFVFLLLRLLWIGDTVYILDEPLMQLRIDEAFAHGEVPLFHSRGSSIPIPYGPGALWFFMVARLFTWHPEGLVAYQLLFQLLGYALFARVVYRELGREALAWALLLLATSPTLFFLSRHAWDSMLFVPIGGAALYFVRKLEGDGGKLALHAALGLLAGYGINTHLMFGPVAVALGATILIRSWRRRSVLPLAVFGACALAVMLPYGLAAVRIMAEEKPFEHARVSHRWGDGRNLWWTFLGTTTYASIFNSRIMLNDLRQELFAYAGQPFAFFFRVDLFGWLGKIAAWGVAAVTLAKFARGRLGDSPVKHFLAFSFLFTVLVYQYLNIPLATHYFVPIWWFVFLGIAFAIRSLHGIGKKVLLASLAGAALVNASYDAFAMAYLHANRGARNMEASVAVAEQLRNLRELCSWAKAKNRAEVKVHLGQVFVGETTFAFLPKHMPECTGVTVSVAHEPANADFLLHYPAGSGTSAALEAEPVTPRATPGAP